MTNTDYEEARQLAVEAHQNAFRAQAAIADLLELLDRVELEPTDEEVRAAVDELIHYTTGLGPRVTEGEE